MKRPSISAILLAGTGVAFILAMTEAKAQECGPRLGEVEQQLQAADLGEQERQAIEQVIESAKLFRQIGQERGCVNLLAEVDRVLSPGDGQQQAAVEGQPGQSGGESVEQRLEQAMRVLQQEQDESGSGASGGAGSDGQEEAGNATSSDTGPSSSDAATQQTASNAADGGAQDGDEQQAADGSAGAESKDSGQQSAAASTGDGPGQGEIEPQAADEGSEVRSEDGAQQATDGGSEPDQQQAAAAGEGEQAQEEEQAATSGGSTGTTAPGEETEPADTMKPVSGGDQQIARVEPGEQQEATADGAATADNPILDLPVDQLVGQEVQNLKGDTVAEVEDLVQQRTDQALFAVLSVGGILGLGDKEVAVELDRFELAEEGKLILPEASESELEELPPYNHALFVPVTQ